MLFPHLPHAVSACPDLREPHIGSMHLLLDIASRVEVEVARIPQIALKELLNWVAEVPGWPSCLM